MDEASNGVTTARWGTMAVHQVGFFDREKRRHFSELLEAAAEYFREREADPASHYRIDDVRWRMGRDGVYVLEVQVQEYGPPEA